MAVSAEYLARHGCVKVPPGSSGFLATDRFRRVQSFPVAAVNLTVKLLPLQRGYCLLELAFRKIFE